MHQIDSKPPLQAKTRSGLTLAEVAISTLLVGVLMVASLRTVESSLRTWQQAARSADCGSLARQLLDEIQTRAYEDTGGSPIFGPESGETSSPANRSLFDDIDDYDGWSASPPQDLTGTALPDYTGWTRSVAVRKLAANGHAVLSSGATDEGLREIEVTVTSPDGCVTALKAWRSRSGGMQLTLGVDQTIVTWVGCSLQADPDDDAIAGGTLVSNHAEDN
jgi:Tfp pilus assembly protein PilV